jgi:hypothetical protein
MLEENRPNDTIQMNYSQSHKKANNTPFKQSIKDDKKTQKNLYKQLYLPMPNQTTLAKTRPDQRRHKDQIGSRQDTKRQDKTRHDTTRQHNTKKRRERQLQIGTRQAKLRQDKHRQDQANKTGQERKKDTARQDKTTQKSKENDNYKGKAS